MARLSINSFLHKFTGKMGHQRKNIKICKTVLKCKVACPTEFVRIGRKKCFLKNSSSTK